MTFSAPITHHTSNELLASVKARSASGVERVTLSVETPGGEVESGLGLYTTLREMPVELVTHNTGEIASMGNVLFLAGDMRRADAEATFVLHRVSVEIGGRQLALPEIAGLRYEVERVVGDRALLVELDLGVARLRREERVVAKVLEERTRLTGPAIAELVRHEATLNASAALAAGIIHEVVGEAGPLAWGPIPQH